MAAGHLVLVPPAAPMPVVASPAGPPSPPGTPIAQRILRDMAMGKAERGRSKLAPSSVKGGADGDEPEPQPHEKGKGASSGVQAVVCRKMQTAMPSPSPSSTPRRGAEARRRKANLLLRPRRSLPPRRGTSLVGPRRASSTTRRAGTPGGSALQTAPAKASAMVTLQTRRHTRQWLSSTWMIP